MKKGFIIVGLIAMLVLIAGWYRECQYVGKWRADYAKLKENLLITEGHAKVAIEVSEGKIAELNGMIDSLSTVIAKKEERIFDLGTTITDLETDLETIPETDTDAIIANLKGQISAWQKRFFEAEVAMTALKEQVALTEKKFQEQLLITKNYKDMWERERFARESLERIVTEMERVARKAGMLRSIERGITVAVAGALVVSLIK